MRKIRILFVHHSTGALLLRFGGVRQQLKAARPEIEFWDHAYNLYPSLTLSKLLGPFTFHTGLSDADGKMTGKDFDITISNNSPKDYAEIFSRKPDDPTLAQILKFDVVAFKNCFPTSGIESEKKLKRFKNYYTDIFDTLAKYRRLFIPFTPPPLRKEATKPSWAKNARTLAEWIKAQKHKNIKIFDFFDQLADKDGPNMNMLRRRYCNPIPLDSHSNITANREVGRTFVEFLTQL